MRLSDSTDSIETIPACCEPTEDPEALIAGPDYPMIPTGWTRVEATTVRPCQHHRPNQYERWKAGAYRVRIGGFHRHERLAS